MCPLAISSNFGEYLSLTAGLNEERGKKKILCDLRSDEFQLEAEEAAADDMRRSVSLFIGAAVVS